MTISEAVGLALQHHHAGRLAEAEAIYRQVLAVDPNEENSLHLLGEIALRRGQLEDAAGLMSRAVAINPGVAEYYNNLALVRTGQGKHEEAAEACRRALELKPDSPEIHNNLGNALRDQGRLEEAIAAYRSAIRYRPDYAGAHSNLGMVLRACGRMEEAVAVCRMAVQLDRNFAEAYINLGTVLHDHGQPGAAMDAYRMALQIKPDLAEAYNNIGDVLLTIGRIDEAITAFDRAIELKPGYEEAKFNCSLSLLLRGDFARGWPLYEARRGLVGKRREFSQPTWDGGLVNGRRLLIHAEQGLGDSMQFIRYAELASARGAQVILECQEGLIELLRGAKGVGEIVKAGDPLPPFDLQVPMLSQPMVFKTTLENIPGEVPYLFADPGRGAAWRDRLGSDKSRLRVGLAWAGNPEHRHHRIRDIALETLRPLLGVNGIAFFSVQVGSGSEQIHRLPDAAAIIDHTEHLQDFADTAALMMELDLIISVDTAVAHLAGALGRPVWTLLPFVPDWRWGLEGEETPWYPTMRLFRQPTRGDWDSVIRRVAKELAIRAQRAFKK